MYTVNSTFSFEAAHRLYDVDTYSSECRENIHGHSYKVSVKLGRKQLLKSGMVIDFKLFKNIVKSTIVDKYDHSCILRNRDPLLPLIQDNCKKVISYYESPTAEGMAEVFYELLEKVFKEHDSELILEEVCVQETENNIASYRRED